ncbi:hypothetical protein Q3C01_08685 [Bradyrhizobium sp. UFLA05-109]
MNLQSLWSILKDKDNVAILAAILAAGKFLFEYHRENKRKRMEMYISLREKFRENDDFDPIFAALDQYNEAEPDSAAEAQARLKLSSIPYGDRYEFVALLDDIAMAMNSGTLKPRVANYSFGHYAILCWEVDEFWTDLRENRNDPYWSLFRRFVKRLEWRQKLLCKYPRLVAFSLRV